MGLSLVADSVVDTQSFPGLLVFILPKPEEVKWQDRTEQQRRALTQE